MKNEHELEHISIEGSKVQQAVALSISQKRIGPRLQEQIDDVVVAFMSCPDYGRSGDRSPLGVDIDSAFDEILAQCVMVVDCCQLWARSVGF